MYHAQPQQGSRRQRPPVQALDLAGSQGQRLRHRPGADEYVALVSPIYDQRFQNDDRRPPGQNPSSPNRGLPHPRYGSPGESMPTMQFNMGELPPRTKSAPPDDPRNWDRNGPPPPRLYHDNYDDRRPPAQTLPMTNGRGPPRRGPPMDRHPPQQLYDRGPEPRRSPVQQPLYDERPPPSRHNTGPGSNGNYDPRGPPQRPYDRGPPNQRDPHFNDRDFYADPRRNPRNASVDQQFDDYVEELGSPPQERISPSRPDYRMDPRIDPRNDPHYNDPHYGDLQQPPRQDPRFNRRSPPYSDSDHFNPPDRRQLVDAGVVSGPPSPRVLQRSQTAPGMGDIDHGVKNMDLRRLSPPETDIQPRGPNKLQKAPPKQLAPANVQPQPMLSPTGSKHNPNGLPVFPSPESSRPGSKDRTSRSSEGSYRPPQVVEKPKLTLAILEDIRRAAKENPSDPAAQLELGKALLEASLVLSHEQGMGDPKRVAKCRENFISEGLKIVKKLSSSVFLFNLFMLMVGINRGWKTTLSRSYVFPCYLLW